MTGLIFLFVISIIVFYASGYATQLYEVFKSFFKSFYYFLCEWLKDKLYKKHIRYTKRLRYNFPSGMTYATEFDSNWYIKETIRNGVVIDSTTIKKNNIKKENENKNLKEFAMDYKKHTQDRFLERFMYYNHRVTEKRPEMKYLTDDDYYNMCEICKNNSNVLYQEQKHNKATLKVIQYKGRNFSCIISNKKKIIKTIYPVDKKILERICGNFQK